MKQLILLLFTLNSFNAFAYDDHEVDPKKLDAAEQEKCRTLAIEAIYNLETKFYESQIAKNANKKGVKQISAEVIDNVTDEIIGKYIFKVKVPIPDLENKRWVLSRYIVATTRRFHSELCVVTSMDYLGNIYEEIPEETLEELSKTLESLPKKSY